MNSEDEDPYELNINQADPAPVEEAVPGGDDDVPAADAEETNTVDTQAVLVRGLEAYFRRHNLQALTLAVFSLVGSAILWALVYVLTYWFILVGSTLARSFNPATLLQISQPDLVGSNFPLYFIVGALLSLAIAGFVRKRWRPEKLREARFYLFWLIAELLLAVPNATFAVWGNLRAITRLRRQDAIAAARLIERLDGIEGGLNLTGLRVEIEDPKVLHRVLFSLQLVGLVIVRERDRGWFLCLQKPGLVAQLCAQAT